ncbi:hypothetical protein B0H17DRAFT_1126843 [Mycena rosella]|uniref:Uncharacterized protein n=1 Tax=Mycena rosella TaxID=1033263 RepID=A0AAD7M790_MYCRO|nr:hypothetical protein B0H17DRAFT_1126843 [Mycena rosella]
MGEAAKIMCCINAHDHSAASTAAPAASKAVKLNELPILSPVGENGAPDGLLVRVVVYSAHDQPCCHTIFWAPRPQYFDIKEYSAFIKSSLSFENYSIISGEYDSDGIPVNMVGRGCFMICKASKLSRMDCPDIQKWEAFARDSAAEDPRGNTLPPSSPPPSSPAPAEAISNAALAPAPVVTAPAAITTVTTPATAATSAPAGPPCKPNPPVTAVERQPTDAGTAAPRLSTPARQGPPLDVRAPSPPVQHPPPRDSVRATPANAVRPPRINCIASNASSFKGKEAPRASSPIEVVSFKRKEDPPRASSPLIEVVSFKRKRAKAEATGPTKRRRVHEWGSREKPWVLNE